ncbi:hypothetical protein PC119_g26726 [Phytophthora cactorum]|uniref:Uncharacterized protein n=2 Tax=Phytophthora cactorum TaxID=29920 RepID=A0A8T1AC53_9STRA|nr:hypothetical protein PC111_g24005 [Phytophthora cactorum]KAG2874693.1 hypothetical protein PC115_g24089 [Phytophthora cactorum]KAG2959379.1 hypothetical protein PC119_g26726 [Phytophthora cactorum]KAG3053618.1 hypothetical protein PI125_g25985 [Phytophthora idaei]KAG3123293.1 hypothetical protein PI126_g23774 [Phytophthora idaei]
MVSCAATAGISLRAKAPAARIMLNERTWRTGAGVHIVYVNM